MKLNLSTDKNQAKVLVKFCLRKNFLNQKIKLKVQDESKDFSKRRISTIDYLFVFA